MDFELSDEQLLLRDTTRDLLSRGYDPESRHKDEVAAGQRLLAFTHLEPVMRAASAESIATTAVQQVIRGCSAAGRTRCSPARAPTAWWSARSYPTAESVCSWSTARP